MYILTQLLIPLVCLKDLLNNSPNLGHRINTYTKKGTLCDDVCQNLLLFVQNA